MRVASDSHSGSSSGHRRSHHPVVDAGPLMCRGPLDGTPRVGVRPHREDETERRPTRNQSSHAAVVRASRTCGPVAALPMHTSSSRTLIDLAPTSARRRRPRSANGQHPHMSVVAFRHRGLGLCHPRRVHLTFVVSQRITDRVFAGSAPPTSRLRGSSTFWHHGPAGGSIVSWCRISALSVGTALRCRPRRTASPSFGESRKLRLVPKGVEVHFDTYSGIDGDVGTGVVT